MEKVINFFKYVLYVFLIGCLGMIIWLGVYYALGWNKYTSITTNYVDDMTYVTEEDSQYFIDINYKSNANNNGQECFEAKLNYYTDVSLPEQNEDGTFKEDKYTFATGIQFNGGFQYDVGATYTTGGSKYGHKEGWFYYYLVEPTNCYYYNIDNQSETAYSATNQISDMNSWIYDIDGDLCQIKSEKTESLGTTNGLIWAERRVCDINYCLLELYNAVKTIEDGEHVITFDLSRFFNIYMYNASSGKFDVEATGKEEWTFVRVHITKDSNGFVDAEQSIFGSYFGDTEWTLYEISEGQDYWQIDNVYNFQLSQFTFVYQNGGYYLKLQDTVLNYLKDFDNVYYIATLDLDNIYLGSEVLEIQGFSENAFGELDISEINLTSEIDRTFYVYDELLPITTTNNITVEVAA